jgi:hypothetical protein
LIIATTGKPLAIALHIAEKSPAGTEVLQFYMLYGLHYPYWPTKKL